MSLSARKVPDVLLFAAVTAHNLEVRDRVASSTSYPHADVTSLAGGNYTAPTLTQYLVAGSAVDLPSTMAVAESARRVLQAHLQDAGAAATLWGGAHKSADGTNLALITLTAAPTSVDLPSVIIVLNALKSACNPHVNQTGVHFTADGTNTISAAAASDLPSSETLAAAIQTFVNAHVAFAGATTTVTPVSA
jgi:hypothetical protein